MKRTITALFMLLNFVIQAKSQTQTIRADKYMIIPRSGLGSAYRTKFITDQVFARHRFYIGSDTSNYQNEAFDVTVNARFGAKIKLGTTYGNAGEYIRSGGSLVNPAWAKIQWSDIEGVPSSANSWIKMPLNGLTGLGLGNPTIAQQPDGTTVLPLIFSAGQTRIGELNQYGQLYGFTRLGINIGFTNTQSSMFQPVGQNYQFILGGKAVFGFNSNMPDAQKTGTYFMDINKNGSSDISRFRFTKYESSGLTNVPKWQLQHGASDDFSIQKLNTNQSIDTTNSIYINAGRFNFGRSTGLNNTKFTFGGSMTVLGDLITNSIFSSQFRFQDGQQAANKILTSDANGYATWQNNKAVTGLTYNNGSFGWNENGDSFATPQLVTLSTAQNITGVKTFQHNTASYMSYFNNTNMSGKGVKFTNTGVFPAIEVWQDLGSTPGVQLWANGDGDFDGYLRSRYFQMSTGGGTGKIMQSNSTGFGSWIDPITLPIPTLVQTALDGKAGLSSNNNFTGSNLFLTPVFANSTSTSSFSSMTGEWVGSGNLATFRWRYNTKVGSNTVTWYPLNIDTNGWVGIGMTPSQAFEVLGAAKFNSAITATSIGASGAVSALSFSSTSGGNLATGGGNIGIGLASPQKKLDVSDVIRSTTNFGGFEAVPVSGTGYRWTLNNDNGYYLQSSTDKFVANASSIMTILGGNIGVGGISPSVKFDVNGSIKNNTSADFATNSGTVNVGSAIGTGVTGMEIGTGRAGTGISYIDLGGESTNTDYGLRLMRDGFNSNIYHAGTGSLTINSINTGNLLFATSNAERMKIFSDGNVSINNSTNAGYKFNVVGNSAFSGNVLLVGVNSQLSLYNGSNMAVYNSLGSRNVSWRRQISGEGDTRGMVYFGYDSTTYNLGMVMKDNGNIGIGLHSPLSKLHIYGTGYVAATVQTTAANAGALTNYITGSRSYSVGGRSDFATGAFHIVDETSAVSRFMINSGGYIGVGTTSPLALLHLKSASSVVGAYQQILEGASGGYGAGISFQSLLAGTSTMGEMARITADGESAWNSTSSTQNAGLRFQTTASGVTREVMKITSGGMMVSQGDISLNGNYPVISMAGTQAGAANIRFHNYISGLSNAGFEIYDQTNTASRMVISSTGNMGIGTNQPTNKLSVSGGTTITNGWTRTMSLHANYPVMLLNSTASSKYAGIGYDGSSSLNFWVNGSSEDISGTGTVALAIKSSNAGVGIGTTSPEQKLHVEGLVKIKAYTTTEINSFSGMTIGTITMNSTIGLPVFYNGTTWKRFDGSNM